MRPFAGEQRSALERLRRSQTEPASQVARAKALLAVAAGQSFTEAYAAGRQSGDAVTHRITRFNRDRLAALPPRHDGGRPKRYTTAAQARTVGEVRRTPDRKQDGTATWSLTTLQQALRQAPAGRRGV